MASFSRLAGMSLPGVTKLVSPVGGPVSGVASSICITSFMTSSCASAMGIYVFSVFNNSFHIRQQGLQLPDDPRHGVGHGIQLQGVAVEQHVAQIFLTRGFDDSVLRVKGVGAKPVQKLRKHSELVQAGGRVHVYVCIYICSSHSFAGSLAQVLMVCHANPRRELGSSSSNSSMKAFSSS